MTHMYTQACVHTHNETNFCAQGLQELITSVYPYYPKQLRFIKIPNKISATFFSDLEKILLKVVRNH